MKTKVLVSNKSATTEVKWGHYSISINYIFSPHKNTTNITVGLLNNVLGVFTIKLLENDKYTNFNYL